MNFNISHFLSSKFKTLGEAITEHTSYFILIPVFLTFLLATGLQNLQFENDIQVTLSSENSQTAKQKEIIKSLFSPIKDENFDLGRETEIPSNIEFIVTAKDGETLFRKSVAKEILLFDESVNNITIEVDGSKKGYTDLCARYHGRCFSNDVLLITDRFEDIKAGKYLLKYPVQINEDELIFKIYGLFFGGVCTDSHQNIKDAKAVRFLYFLADDSPSKKAMANRWQNEVLNKLAEVCFESISVETFAAVSMPNEILRVSQKVIHLFFIALVIVLTFSGLTCLHNDWIQSKPWTGVVTVISSGLAIASSVGLLSYCSVPISNTVNCLPFLIIGIGMDDTFILLAAWQKTDRKNSVKERLGEAYKKAAVSITITSLTNFIAFTFGLFVSLFCLRNFCIYASVTIVFAYAYQLTFVGGWMAICGHLEKQNRHSLFFIPLMPPTGNEGWIYRFLCTSKSWKMNSPNKENKYLWDRIGKFLSSWPAKGVSFLIFIAYLTIAVLKVKNLPVFLDLMEALPYDSYTVRFFDKLFNYFPFYLTRVQFVIDEELDYSDPAIQHKIEELLTKIENTSYIADSSLTEFWLRYYVKFLNHKSIRQITSQYNMTNNKDFILILRQLFLRHPLAKRFEQDIAFNDNYTAIIGSRIICQTYDVTGLNSLYDAIIDLRNLTSMASFSIFPYHPYNFVCDTIQMCLKLTIQSLISVTIVIVIICFLFVPNILMTFAIISTIVSITIGTMGYMVLWGVDLTLVSMLMLVLSVGFCVDYSAHISYTYSVTKNEDPNERMSKTISAVGMAIFQGSCTTILSILLFVYPLAPLFSNAFKVVFLVILFSAIHSIVFLPTTISTLELFYEFIHKKSEHKSRNINLTENAISNSGYLNTEIELQTVNEIEYFNKTT